MRPAIRIHDVSKRYSLGGPRGLFPATLRDAISGAASTWSRRLTGREARAGGDPRDTFWALRDVSLDVAPGERVALIGRNGAGKSTLLKIVSRITEPTTGWVGMNGRVASLLEVGTGFHPELSGRENVFLNGSLLGMSRSEIRARFDEIVAFAEVERFLDVPVKRYSSGMYVRLAFAVAAHLDPEILVVDEVLAVGDAQFQQKCLGKMKEVSRSGRTILFVSHNMNAVRSLCDRAVLLAGGRVVEDGPVAAVAARYAATSHEPRLERVWPDPERAPRNATTILERVSIRKLDGQADDALTIADAFRIDVHYRVAVAGAKVGVTAMLHDAEGQCIFSSIGNREPAWYGKPMPAGRYRSSCTVPGNLLNSGTFSLSLLLFGSRFMDEFHAPEALVFDLGDSPALRSDFHGDWKGAIRPDLGWTTTPVGEDGA